MLARASSDAGTRLRRSKSTSTVHRQLPLISEPFNPNMARQHALVAATTAFARAQVHDAAGYKTKRSSEIRRSKSNASRKSLTSQGSHFPAREPSVRSSQPLKTEQSISSHRQFQGPLIDTEQFPPFYPTPSSGRPSSAPRPLSAQPSITFGGHGLPRSHSKQQRQSAPSSVASLQIRKARSMYYASSIQTGSPIARPPAKYLTTPAPSSDSPALESLPTLRAPRTPGPSPLAGPRLPVTIQPDGSVDKARDTYLQSFQQKTVKHKPSALLAPFKKRQEKAKQKGNGATFAISISSSDQQMYDRSTADNQINEFHTQPVPKEKRSFSGSLKSRFKKVFRRASKKLPYLPVQQIGATRDYFNTDHLNLPDTENIHAIPSPDEETLRRARSRTPSLDGSIPAFIRSGSRTSSNGSARSNTSNRSLHSETHITHASASRVTSWGTTSTGDTLTQRAIKRLTVIHEAKDSIGSEADHVASIMPQKKPLPFPVLSAFREPMSMNSLVQESLTPVDPKRVFSALMREIGTSKISQLPSSRLDRTPGAESDVFESSETKALDLQGREPPSSNGRDFRPNMGSDQRPPSRRPPSTVAQSVQSKSSTIKSLGKVIRSSIRAVTPAEKLSSPSSERTGSVRGAVRVPRDDIDTPSSTATTVSDGSDESSEYAGLEYNRLTRVNNSLELAYPPTSFTPSAAQIEKRVERANYRWKSTLEEINKPQFPRETDRTYNISNFTQETTSYGVSDDTVDDTEPSPAGFYVLNGPANHQVAASELHSASPGPRPMMSPLSPSIYSRNTDGMSILPNDSMISLPRPVENQHANDAGSAVILESHSVRSYVIGTPSPRRPDSTRTSRDWKAWLSHEISGMEYTNQEDLRIHARYAPTPTQHLDDITRTSHIENDDTTVILHQYPNKTTSVLITETPIMADASKAAEQLTPQNQSKHDEPSLDETASSVLEFESHQDTCKEVSPTCTPPLRAPGEVRRPSLKYPQGPTPLSNKQRVASPPSCSRSATQSVLETPRASRMNDRFPFIDTGRRSSSNSVKSSRHSKSPPESIASLKSSKASLSPKIYSDFLSPTTDQTAQWVPNTTLKRSDAQHKRKENWGPSSSSDSSKPNSSPAVLGSRPQALQTLSSATLNRNTCKMGQHVSNTPELEHLKNNPSSNITTVRPQVRATLRPISPEKLSRRPKSAFDLRETTLRYPAKMTVRSTTMKTSTASERPYSELYLPGLKLRTSSNSLVLDKEPNPSTEEQVIDSMLHGEHSVSVTPGQRMVDRFLKERKSTTMLDGAKMRGGLKLTREDTPAFL
ncbi:hypothetical protein BKA66DRAFT_421501 [Pyrenochaeta sp. MPI-SDFR-AT-0127]|nr:hypothetical protein BKA66DRAFT_421501 [Pyrenochaeta sp. MPI-SDFR-AT-0127]